MDKKFWSPENNTDLLHKEEKDVYPGTYENYVKVCVKSTTKTQKHTFMPNIIPHGTISEKTP